MRTLLQRVRDFGLQLFIGSQSLHVAEGAVRM